MSSPAQAQSRRRKQKRRRRPTRAQLARRRAVARALAQARRPKACPRSLDFTGRLTVMLHEMATRLGCTVRHLLNEIEAGALTALDISGQGRIRRRLRVPIEAYRDYVVRHLTGPFPTD